MMKHGDIVTFSERIGLNPSRRKRVLGVALYVSLLKIRSGINVCKPGVYVFRGYWYGNNPKHAASYGKIEGRVGTVIGTVRNHAQIKSLGI